MSMKKLFVRDFLGNRQFAFNIDEKVTTRDLFDLIGKKMGEPAIYTPANFKVVEFSGKEVRDPLFASIDKVGVLFIYPKDEHVIQVHAPMLKNDKPFLFYVPKEMKGWDMLKVLGIPPEFNILKESDGKSVSISKGEPLKNFIDGPSVNMFTVSKEVPLARDA
jgi:hypothetical protein